MLFLRNLRFVRKIQFGFLILGVIAAMIAANSIFQINKMSNSKSAIQTEFINPKEYIDNVYLEFQKIQFIMLKFSIPEFHSDFQDHVTTYNFHKTKGSMIMDWLDPETCEIPLDESGRSLLFFRYEETIIGSSDDYGDFLSSAPKNIKILWQMQ